MTLPVILRPAARREFDEAADWYERQRQRLGDRFATVLKAVLDEVAANPRRFPVVFEGLRVAIVPKFPYGVYF